MSAATGSVDAAARERPLVLVADDDPDARLIAAMKRAESKMPPVLDAFRDQVLFLKHNLNARAIASLEGTIGEIESDVASLIRDIDASIEEAGRFLDTLEAAS